MAHVHNTNLKAWPTPFNGVWGRLDWTRDDDSATGRFFTLTALASGTFVCSDAGPEPFARVSGAATTDNSGSNFLSTVALLGMAENRVARFATRLSFSEATESEFYFGWVSQDTDLAGGFNHGFYLRKADGSTALEIVTELSTTEVEAKTVHTVVAGTAFDVAVEVIGLSATEQQVVVYINGLVAYNKKVAGPVTANEVLRLGGEFRSGDTTGTRYVDFVRPLDWEIQY